MPTNKKAKSSNEDELTNLGICLVLVYVLCAMGATLLGMMTLSRWVEGDTLVGAFLESAGVVVDLLRRIW